MPKQYVLLMNLSYVILAGIILILINILILLYISNNYETRKLENPSELIPNQRAQKVFWFYFSSIILQLFIPVFRLYEGYISSTNGGEDYEVELLFQGTRSYLQIAVMKDRLQLFGILSVAILIFMLIQLFLSFKIFKSFTAQFISLLLQLILQTYLAIQGAILSNSGFIIQNGVFLNPMTEDLIFPIDIWYVQPAIGFYLFISVIFCVFYFLFTLQETQLSSDTKSLVI